MSTKTDPLIDDIRQVRHEISARFGHDPRKYYDYLLEREQNLRAVGKHRFAGSPKGTARRKKAAANKGKQSDAHTHFKTHSNRSRRQQAQADR